MSTMLLLSIHCIQCHHFIIWWKGQKTKLTKNAHSVKNQACCHTNNIAISVLDLKGFQSLHGSPLLKLLSIVDLALNILIEQSDQDSLIELSCQDIIITEMIECNIAERGIKMLIFFELLAEQKI